MWERAYRHTQCGVFQCSIGVDVVGVVGILSPDQTANGRRDGREWEGKGRGQVKEPRRRAGKDRERRRKEAASERQCQRLKGRRDCVCGCSRTRWATQKPTPLPRSFCLSL